MPFSHAGPGVRSSHAKALAWEDSTLLQGKVTALRQVWYGSRSARRETTNATGAYIRATAERADETYILRRARTKASNQSSTRDAFLVLRRPYDLARDSGAHRLHGI